MKILVTGGGGFIGSVLVRALLAGGTDQVVNLDKVTYAASPRSLEEFLKSPNYTFCHVDLADSVAVEKAVAHHRPDRIMHLAAESHVDRSIDGPADFIQSNIVGTFNLLQAARRHWETTLCRAPDFRFHHVSTDEVYGALGPEGLFTEETPYRPSSPYSASKASSDHLVRAWHTTYGLPVLITNCSNNYGPYQYPEKLIPRMILRGLKEQPLPLYGTGQNVRDWLYVEDHVHALQLVLSKGRVGETYNIGGSTERTNLVVTQTLCDILDRLVPPHTVSTRRELIHFVEDRPGHDFRYSIDATKIRTELGWAPLESFETSLEKTVRWYLSNPNWWGSSAPLS